MVTCFSRQLQPKRGPSGGWPEPHFMKLSLEYRHHKTSHHCRSFWKETYKESSRPLYNCLLGLRKPPLLLRAWSRPISATMDSINNSDDFTSSSDTKATIIKQIQQEAAMNNARQLIQVKSLHFRSPKFRSLASDVLLTTPNPYRNSTCTASTNVFPHLGAASRKRKKYALPSVWKSIWRRGIR